MACLDDHPARSDGCASARRRCSDGGRLGGVAGGATDGAGPRRFCADLPRRRRAVAPLPVTALPAGESSLGRLRQIPAARTAPIDALRRGRLPQICLLASLGVLLIAI